MMECAAAGRLPLGTPVGYFEENAPQGGGILLPLDEASFMQEAQVQLNFYKKNKISFIGRCKEIKEYALEFYDWRVKIASWIKLFCE